MELEFILDKSKVDLGLGHVVEIMGVNTDAVRAVYTEKKEEIAEKNRDVLLTVKGMEVAERKKRGTENNNGFMNGWKKDGRKDGMVEKDMDEFESDRLLDGSRAGFVSRVDSLKRRFVLPPVSS